VNKRLRLGMFIVKRMPEFDEWLAATLED